MPETDSEEADYNDCWIQKFLRRQENMYLERLPDSFLLDKFHFNNLKERIEDFRECYQAIMDRGPSYNMDEETKLYFYLHNRYILYNKQGMNNMLDKIKTKTFGTCQRYGCKETPFIPVGLHPDFGRSKTKVFCSSCKCLYEPKGNLRKLDGCVWGSAFSSYVILLNQYDFKHKNNKTYFPKLFGFDVLFENGNKSSDSE
ncbi:CkIIbeta2 [Ecytonucleospora hepatopenaei]|uniref:Casein kinase II subunit beta n=1 Tax=Ecytonucleospora hepatopenaei TaxID=646526 RepID=A0A1W0E5T3_9MICR|nr:CkIIbeta2 [Ecytonucleospora hepatopenaei]